MANVVADVQLCFADPDAPIGGEAHSVRKGHGRIVQRWARTSQLLHGYANFPGLRQVIAVRCQAISLRTGEVKEETQYGVASRSPSQADARTLMLLMNRHWGLENRNYHVRDDSWREDRQVWRKGNGAHTMSTLLGLALNLLRARSPYWTTKTFLPHRADIIRDLTLNHPDAFKMVS